MNLLLLESSDLRGESLAELRGRRRDHLEQVLRAEPGRYCRAGLLGGLVGRAEVLELTPEHARLRLELTQPPPPPPELRLLAALPRPKTCRKVLAAAVQLGIKELWFFHCFKVEKSYWQSPLLEPERLADEIRLNLEQAADTQPLQVNFRRRFKPWVEDELPGLVAGSRVVVAHPAGALPCPVNVPGPVTLILGPEGGFTPYEVELLARNTGAEIVRLGSRILRTETALPALAARLKELP